ncbi:hypothetical protein [Cellulosimicrobium sp. SH8]|uniref:hypothetical protein n=1 Tax=Cellulosimicrobium sp. SH8 TaxID=2952936 RepID=UPI0021F3BD26|nr:hypothetical protein [Cellulosimicrobium sp. SH8]
MTDLMKRLRATDPVRRADLGAVDDAAFAALREEILMTTTLHPTNAAPAAHPSRRRRLGRRGMVALGLATVLAGSGVAYAAIQAFRGSSGEGVTCVSAWTPDVAEGLDVDAAGPWLTGDPYADCTTLLAEQGLPPIEDPVAFAWDGQTYVAPAGQVPDGVERLESRSALDPAVVELQQSATDRVDGGASACRTVAEGVAWAQEELARLGLEGWSVGEQDALPEPADGAQVCAEVTVDVGEPAIVVGGTTGSDGILEDSLVAGIVTALKGGITDRCVSLDEARAVADEALSVVDGPFPTTSVPDESVTCARVDLVVGGSFRATVYGPTTAG